MVCPYGVIKRDISIKRAASKCDFCIDEKIPVCVKNCPNEALRFSDIEADNETYGGADSDSAIDSGNNSGLSAGADYGSSPDPGNIGDAGAGYGVYPDKGNGGKAK